jgi:Bacteriophytochrome (light-regulated signal transduction histidine kinase)
LNGLQLHVLILVTLTDPVNWCEREMRYAYLKSPHTREQLFYIVAVGAATGGLASAVELFSHLPDRTGMTYFYIQHGSEIKNNVVMSLQEVTNMPVLHIANGYPVLPDHLYILPTDKEVSVKQHQFQIRPLGYDASLMLPADRIFKELAATFPQRTIGIALSGLTPDGSAGLQAIQAAGGRTFVQEHTTLEPKQMARALNEIRLRYHPLQPKTTTEEKPAIKPPPPSATYQRADKTLQTLSADLEQFTYVASHDLQEPLRKIVTYSDRLRQRFIDMLPDTGQSYIEKIIDSAQHMSRLLDDLVHYSKLSAEKAGFAKTRLNELMDRVLHNLRDVIQNKQAGISYMSLPEIECIPQQVELLLHQLIDNALKFAHPMRPPEITIMSRPLKQQQLQQFPQLNRSLTYHEIIVADNGIGFKPEFAKQIFLIFQRLNDKKEFSGTGIGLALCRKIAQIHNGDIYGESKEEEGSVFHIVLPGTQE